MNQIDSGPQPIKVNRLRFRTNQIQASEFKLNSGSTEQFHNFQILNCTIKVKIQRFSILNFYWIFVNLFTKIKTFEQDKNFYTVLTFEKETKNQKNKNLYLFIKTSKQYNSKIWVIKIDFSRLNYNLIYSFVLNSYIRKQEENFFNFKTPLELERYSNPRREEIWWLEKKIEIHIGKCSTNWVER